MKSPHYFPMYEVLSSQYGLVVAGVFGIIENYSRLKKGYCYLTQVQIGEKLKVSYKPVQKALRTLLSLKLIQEYEPIRRKKLDSSKYYIPLRSRLAELSLEPGRPMLKANENRKFSSELRRKMYKCEQARDFTKELTDYLNNNSSYEVLISNEETIAETEDESSCSDDVTSQFNF